MSLYQTPLLTLTPAVQTNSSLRCSLDFNRLLLSVLFKICINDPQAINVPSWTIKFYINNVSLFEPCRQFFSSSFRKNFSITFFQIIQIPQMQDYTEKEPRWLKMEKIYKWIIWKLQVNPLTVMKLLFKRMDGFRRLTFKKIQTWFFSPVASHVDLELIFP